MKRLVLLFGVVSTCFFNTLSLHAADKHVFKCSVVKVNELSTEAREKVPLNCGGDPY